MNKHASSLIGIGLAALMSAPAANASSAESRLIEALVEEGTLSRERADALLAEDAPVKRFESFDYEPTMPVVGDDIRARVNKFAIETADGKHRFGFRGRLMADAAWLENPFKTTDDERADRGDIARYGTILRRARLGALGVMCDNWEWQLEVDFRDDEVRFANAYIAYLFPQGRLAVGHFKEPFSMESSTSSRRITFIERAAPVDAYRPSRELGVMYETILPRWYAAAGLFGGDGVARDRDVSEGWSFAGRTSFAPVLDEEAGLWSHLGLSVNYRRNAYEYERSRGRERQYNPVRMRTRLGTRAVDGRMIGENDMENVRDWTTYALEAAWGTGPFSLQGEYLVQTLFRDEESRGFEGANPEVTEMESSGYYLQANWFLTGEQRNYRAFSGDFGRTSVDSPLSKGGRGAWELAARFATADSMEHHVADDRQKIDHYTFALNWYPEDDIILKFNVMYIDAERGIDPVDGGPKSWESMAYALRFQYEF